MARTTQAAVEAIIEVDEDAVADLTPFIDAANELVTEICAPVATYTAARLELIERWLAAHFYAVRDPRVASEGVKGVTASYQHRVGLHLAVTTYGQQAMLLDTNGGLAALSKRMEEGTVTPTVGVTWLGEDYDADDEEEEEE